MSKKFLSIIPFLILISFLFTTNTEAYPNPSYSKHVPVDTVPFYANGTYDESIPKPNDNLSEPIGHWPLRYHELETYITLLAEKSDRVKMEVGGKSHEGRNLYNIYIGLPKYISQLDEIKAKAARLASPDKIQTDAELQELIASMPAVAWLGYSIHGDEISGVDAGLQLAYQLAAGTDSATLHLLENVLVIIDPSENPDGRERYLSMLQTYRSNVPNYDRNAQQHQGVWPWGRGNHYLFDLNRDWIFQTQPETEKRTKVILDWHPHLVVDAHEMGSNATFLFTPPRQPINYNVPASVHKWWNIFQRDQGAAFDKNGWPYYIKEWHEQWYPGYGSAWPTFFGTIGILYEQAGVDGSFVKQRDGYLLTYHEAVNHQFRSSLTNLFTLANNKTEILKDYNNTRKKIIADGKKSNLSYLVVPDADEIKVKRFIESLVKQDIRVEQATEEFTVGQGADIFKNSFSNKKFPQGTYIIKIAQPHGSLAKAILEFDPHFKLDFLKDERRELEKYNETKMYEVSAWSAPLAYNLDAYETKSAVSAATKKVTTVALSEGMVVNPGAQFGFVIDMVGEKTYLILNKLFEEQVTVFASEKPFSLEGRSYKPGAILIRNRGNYKNLVTVLQKLTKEVGINAYGVNSGMASEGSYLGAGTYRLLTQPKIALLSGSPLGNTSFGSLWFTIDKQLELPHSLINLQSLAFSDLSAYNVLIIPSAWGNYLGSSIGQGGLSIIKEWVADGGTLIAVGNAAVWAADSSTGLSQVKLKRQSLKEMETYTRAIKRAMEAEAPEVDTMLLYHPDKVPAVKAEEEKKESPSAAATDAEELDEWQRRFMPRGALLMAELDKEHWLNFGLGTDIPVQLYTSHAFLSKDPVQTAVRLTTDKNKLRLSGLLWPEGRERWAGTSYLTRETHGKGQIILFADNPNNRAYFYGTRQLFLNAVMYGPGFGSRFDGPYNQSEER